ncbi:MAG: sulfatase-like hydrolase/transferase [Calditrichaeota bacterium]|nr:sulfatase-like hydrolase/transferase [Calditrichota bacterium]
MSKKTTRRQFLKQTAIGSGAMLAGFPLRFSDHLLHAPAKRLSDRPNFIFIITDEERSTQHFPDNWEQNNLPNLTRLKNHGLSFNNSFCNSCMCSPSRATFFTGIYPALHGVTGTLPEAEGSTEPLLETTLSTELPNMAQILRSAGYQVYYKGKWHMSVPEGSEWQASDLEKYGCDDWDPPDAGEDLDPENYGAGRANHDARFVADAVGFLQQIDDTQPFALFVSLVNPHDISAYPDNFTEDFDDSMLEGDLTLPPTVYEDLEKNYKPTAQAELLNKLDIGLGKLTTVPRKKNYVNFYANLLKHVDEQIGEVLDAIEAPRQDKPPLSESTIIFRFADHGEMGLSHGGMRQKMFVAYEEALRVPIIVSNPALFPEAKTSDALISLIDILPTVATLAQAPNMEKYDLRGVDFSSIIENPEAEPVQEDILFTFDDVRAGTPGIEQLVDPPNRIYCIREKDWKFAQYYDIDNNVAPEYEMYDLAHDPNETENLAHPDHPRYNDPDVVAERNRLANKLALRISEKLAPLQTGVSQKTETQPVDFSPLKNYPNPFNNQTRLEYQLKKSSAVRLQIFNLRGQLVKNLIEEIQTAGKHTIEWDGKSEFGQVVSSGLYFAHLYLNENLTAVRKLHFLK